MSDRFAAAVFDLDGLLVESESRWKLAERRFVEERGGTYSAEMGLATTGASAGVTARILAAAVGWPEDRIDEVPDEVYAALEQAIDELGLELMPGAAELVGSLREAMPLAVASNTRTETVVRNLTRCGLERSFAAVLGSDGLVPKPAPDVYLAACRAIDVAPAEAIAFEDSLPGATAARAAGMTVVLVPTDPELVFAADLRLASLADFSLDLLR